jgi:hypothetical protein
MLKNRLLQQSIILSVMIIYLLGMPLYAQSRVPKQTNPAAVNIEDENWLQVVSALADGDRDRTQVVFFEVPETETNILYFAIRDPESTTANTIEINEGTVTTDYYLIGGSGTLSDPDNSRTFFSQAELISGVHRSGTEIANYRYDNSLSALLGPSPAADDSWVYFPGVLASQGEKIGNKYYFKIVVQSQESVDRQKNAFQLDVSYVNSGTPTGSSTIRAFAYSWTINMTYDSYFATWEFYPFVPDTASGYIEIRNFDFDNVNQVDTFRIDSSTVAYTATTGLNLIGNSDTSANPTEAYTSFPIGGIPGQDVNGTWIYRITELNSNPGFVQNTAELWANLATVVNTPTENLRIYADYFQPPPPQKVILSAADGFAQFTPDLETVTLQISDNNGDPLPYGRTVYLTVSGSASIVETVGAAGTTAVGAQTATVLTDNGGLASFTVENTVAETVQAAVYWDGTGGSDSFGTASSDSLSIVFDSAAASIDSGTNQDFDLGSAPQTLAGITITDIPGNSITTGPNIRIRIPDSLNAVFVPIVDLSGTFASSFGGGGAINAGALSYEGSNKIVVIPVTGDFDTAGDSITAGGLQITNFGAVSSGLLELSIDGGTSYSAMDGFVISLSSTNPVVISRETRDTNSDGQIDQIVFTTDQSLLDAFGGVPISVTGYTEGLIETGTTTDDNSFVLNLTPSGSPDTDAMPDVEILGNTTLFDSSGTFLLNADTAAIPALDGAGPVIVSAQTVSISEVEVTFSESVDDSSLQGADFLFSGFLVGAANTNGISVSTGLSANDNVVLVELAASVGVDESAAFIQFNSTGLVSDLNGNTNSQIAALGISDGVPANPVITSRVTRDTNSDGQIDRIEFTVSEPVNDVFTDLNMLIAGTNYTIGSFNTGAVVTDNQFYVDVIPSGTPDSDATPIVQVVANTALEGTISLADLPIDAGAVSSDGSSPALVYAHLRTSSEVEVVFSESIDDSSMAAIDFLFSGFATAAANTYPISFSTGTTADDNTVLLYLAAPIAAAESGNLAFSAANRVEDLSNNGNTQTAAIAVYSLTNTWNGAGINWSDGTNWSNGTPPQSYSLVVIPDFANDPILNAADVVIAELTIEDGAVVDTNTFQLTVNGDVSLGVGSELDIASNDFTLTGSYTSSGVLSLRGSQTVTGLPALVPGAVQFLGTATGLLLGNQYNDLIIAGGTRTLDAALDIEGSLTINGTLDADGNQINIAGNWGGSGTFTANANTVVFDGTSIVSGTAVDFHHFTIAASSSCDASALTINVSGDFTVSDPTSTFTAPVNPQSLTMDGAADQDITLNGETLDFLRIETNGTVQVQDAFNASWIFLDDGSSRIDFGTQDFTLTGGFDFAPAAAAARIQLDGSNTVAGFGVSDTSEGIVEYYGAGTDPITATAFFDLIISGGIKTLTAATNVYGSIDISGGLDVTASNHDLSVGGNWSRSGTFNPRGGTVILNGANAGDITTAETFFNLTVDGNSKTSSVLVQVGGNMSISSGSYTHSTANLEITGDLDIDGGDLQIDSTMIVDGQFNLSAGTFDGSGTSTIELDVDLSGGSFEPAGSFEITSGDLLVSASTHNSTGTVTLVGGNVEISGGTFTNDALLDIQAGIFTVNGGTSDGSGDINASGNIALSSGELVGSGRTIEGGGDWTEAAAAVFTAASGTVNFSGTGNISDGNLTNDFFNLSIESPGGNITLLSDLELAGSLTIDGSLDSDGFQITLAGNWDSSTGSYVHGGSELLFNSAAAQSMETADSVYDLTLDGGTELVLNSSLTVDNTLTLTNPGDILDFTTQDFILSGALSNNGQIRLDGSQAVTTVSSFDNDSGAFVYEGNGVSIGITDFHDLRIDSSGTVTLSSDINLEGSLYLDGGILSASTYSINIADDFDSTGGGTFVPDTGEVIFDGTVLNDGNPDNELRGDNNFYNLTIEDGGRIVTFAAGSITTILAGGTFTADAGPGPSRIHLHSSASGFPYSQTGTAADVADWTLTLNPSAFLDLHYVYIYNSIASPTLVVPPDNVDATADCIGWLVVVNVTNSQTVDLDGDGRIDRIEVTVETNIGNDFSGFQVDVPGYQVTGYGYPGVGNVFYIDLEENAELDGEATPLWSVLENTTLYDFSSGTRLVNPTATELALDAVAPRLAHTIARADGYQIYIRFSEPVRSAGGADLGPGNFSTGAGTVLSVSPLNGSGNLGADFEEYLIDLDSPISADTILDQLGLTITDFEDRTSGNPDAVPGDWIHRISDFGLSVVDPGILFPVYAYDQTERKAADGSWVDGTDQSNQGTGQIDSNQIDYGDFDGSGWLRDQVVNLQAVFTSSASSYPGSVQLVFDVAPPTSLTEPQSWLPIDLPGFNRTLNPASRTLPATLTLPIVDFIFDPDDSEFSDGAEIQFYFIDNSAPDYLVFPRVDSSSGKPWYYSIEPWSFYVRDILSQRSGFTILDNVINPEEGETAKIQYLLPEESLVTIQVFGLDGDLVKVIYRDRQQAGDYSTVWDGRSSGGEIVAAGIYFVRFTGAGIDEIRKVYVAR